MYFLRRLRPLEVDGERVRSLRFSLNAPVLSTPDLPVGPARAVIVVHQEARGRMDATVGVRSQRSGELAYWSFDGDLSSADDLDVAADAALSFAESLGFLFEDEVLGSGSDASKAWLTWIGGELRAQANAQPAGERAARAPVDDLLGETAERELMIEELMLEELELEDPAAAALPRAAMTASLMPAPQAAPRVVRAPSFAPPSLATPEPPLAAPSPRTPARLSKFRAASAAAVNAASNAKPKTPARQPLARVQLVKRRSPEEERKLLLRKLLTSF
jgi:hypothetical protein